jgi:hypothetical protein
VKVISHVFTAERYCSPAATATMMSKVNRNLIAVRCSKWFGLWNVGNATLGAMPCFVANNTEAVTAGGTGKLAEGQHERKYCEQQANGSDCQRPGKKPTDYQDKPCPTAAPVQASLCSVERHFTLPSVAERPELTGGESAVG